MALSDIVSVTISTTAPAITQAGFGIPLIAGYHTHFAERVRYYTSLSGMLTDGFVATDGFYKAAAAMLAQSPTVETWAVGRCALAPTMTWNLTPAAVHSAIYGISILSDTEVNERFPYTADSATTVQEIVEGLVAAIGSSVTNVTATEDNTKVVLTGSAGKWFGVAVDDNTGNANGMGQWTVKDVTADPGIATDLGNILTENNDWYGLILVHKSEAIINAAAAWVESNKKLFVASTQDTDAKGSGSSDILSDIETGSYARTAGMYHEEQHQFADAAWMGGRFPYVPGSTTWKFCTLAGVDASILTATERANIKAKHANYYVAEGGVGMTFFGWTGANEWIDTTHFIDWLTAEIQTNEVQMLANATASGRKVPFTEEGRLMVEAPLRAALDQGIKNGGLASDPEPVITTPPISDVSSANKAARIYPGSAFSATLAGAIHELTITGVVAD